MSKLAAGTFEGTAPGHNGDITVALTTDGERITDLKLVKEQETPHVGDNALKWLPEAIVKNQSVGVDAVSGASFTSRGIINATKKH
jgi:urocanate reductase